MGIENGGDQKNAEWQTPKTGKEKKKKVETDAEWVARIKRERPVYSPEQQRECEPEIKELEQLFTAFEAAHSLEQLLLITDLTQKDAPNHPVREPAKKALEPILAKLGVLKRETNISPEKYLELDAKYKILSRAVGMINNNKVDHDR